MWQSWENNINYCKSPSFVSMSFHLLLLLLSYILFITDSITAGKVCNEEQTLLPQVLWRWKDGHCLEEVETQKQAFQLLTLLGFSQGTALKLSLDSHSTFLKCSCLYKKNHIALLCKGFRAPGTWGALNFSLPLFLSYNEKHLKQTGFLLISCKWSWEEKLLIALTDLQEAHPQHA